MAKIYDENAEPSLFTYFNSKRKSPAEAKGNDQEYIKNARGKDVVSLLVSLADKGNTALVSQLYSQIRTDAARFLAIKEPKRLSYHRYVSDSLCAFVDYMLCTKEPCNIPISQQTFATIAQAIPHLANPVLPHISPWNTDYNSHLRDEFHDAANIGTTGLVEIMLSASNNRRNSLFNGRVTENIRYFSPPAIVLALGNLESSVDLAPYLAIHSKSEEYSKHPEFTAFAALLTIYDVSFPTVLGTRVTLHEYVTQKLHRPFKDFIQADVAELISAVGKAQTFGALSGVLNIARKRYNTALVKDGKASDNDVLNRLCDIRSELLVTRAALQRLELICQSLVLSGPLSNDHSVLVYQNLFQFFTVADKPVSISLVGITGPDNRLASVMACDLKLPYVGKLFSNLADTAAFPADRSERHIQFARLGAILPTSAVASWVSRPETIQGEQTSLVVAHINNPLNFLSRANSAAATKAIIDIMYAADISHKPIIDSHDLNDQSFDSGVNKTRVWRRSRGYIADGIFQCYVDSAKSNSPLCESAHPDMSAYEYRTAI